MVNENEGPKEDPYPSLFRCYLDGDALAVVKKDFINSAESDVFFVRLTDEEQAEIRKMFPEVGVYD